VRRNQHGNSADSQAQRGEQREREKQCNNVAMKGKRHSALSRHRPYECALLLSAKHLLREEDIRGRRSPALLRPRGL